MPGKRSSRLAAITSSSGTKVSPPSPIGRKRRSSSFGTLTRAATSSSFSGFAEQDAEAERQVRDVGERPAAADHERASAPGTPGW